MKKNVLDMDLQFFAKGEEEENPDNPGEGKDKSKDNPIDNKDKDKSEASNEGSEATDEDDKVKLTDEMKQQLLDEGKTEALKELGLDGENDDGKKFIDFFKSFMESQNANEEEESPDAKALKQELLLTEAKVEALKNGAKPEYVDDVVSLALNKKKENEKLEDVVINLKSKYDFFFGADEDDEESKGTGTSKRNRKKMEPTDGIGARLAAQRKPKEQKKSYW